VVIDFGDDALTVGRAHPMIDPTLRLEALAAVVAAGEPAVLLLDVVLGHGADPDPAATLVPALRTAVAAGLPVVVALIGTEADPQGWSRQADALAAAGAAVFASNAAATRYALDQLGVSA
jgi:FdrA protein